MERAEFSAAVRKRLAERAGYQCSVLNCGRLTVGPGPGPDSVVDIGMAAHIFAAAEGGPRGTGGLSIKERSSLGNGIWCCFDHGKVIDSGGGSEFSVAQLKAWKRLHEARKGAEVNGSAFASIGLVESITINAAPASLAGRKFELGMRNIITGPNNSGKSMLTRLIASVANPSHVAEISQWRDVDMAIRWFDPLTHVVNTVGRAGRVRHVLDGRDVPYVARAFKTILLSGHTRIPFNVASLAQRFDLSAAAMRATLELLPERSELVRELHVSGDDVECVIAMAGRTVRSSDPGWQPGFEGLVLLELAGVHAQHHARVEPTLLLLDEFLDFLHPAMQVSILERLERAAEHAQVAVVSHSLHVVSQCSHGWSALELEPSGHESDRGCPIDMEIEST